MIAKPEAGVTNNASFSASTLYLQLQSQEAFTLSLNDVVYDDPQHLYIVNGLEPGKYLLQVYSTEVIEPGLFVQATPTSTSSANAVKKKQASQKLQFYGYITIAPKHTIYAYIDANMQYRISSLKRSKTVMCPNEHRQQELGRYAQVVSPAIVPTRRKFA